jgi:HSP20 family molecular chaperone IbpA
MSTIVKTCEEFSSRRKIRYGAGSSVASTGFGTLTASSINASMSPHKSYYGRDQDDVPSYFIEFNIGNFQFDEITIRTEDHRRLVVQGKSKANPDTDEVSREFTRDFTLPNNVDQYSIRAQLEETTRQLTLIGQLNEDTIKSLAKTTANELKGASLNETSANLAAAMSATSISNNSSSSAYTSSTLASSTLAAAAATTTTTSTQASSLATSSANTASSSSYSAMQASSNLASSTYSATKTQSSATAASSTIASNNSEISAITSNEKRSNFNSNSKLGSVFESRQTNSIEYEIYLGNELKDGKVNLELVGYNTLIVRVIKSDWDKSGDFSIELKRQIKLPYNSNPQNAEHGILPSGTLLIKVPFK